MRTILRSARRYCIKVGSFLSRRIAPHSKYSFLDLRLLDASYKKMFLIHCEAHRGIINMITGQQGVPLLEVACGAGYAIPFFLKAGFRYNGLDISETALVLAQLRFPQCQFFNLGISDCSVFKDNAFDVVYCSSMLEHIGYYDKAINEMIRIAGKEVIILFFEGLSESENNLIEFHPYSARQLNGKEKDLFGMKIVVQDHEGKKGWYWNRYSKKSLLSILEARQDIEIELFDRTKLDCLNKETLLRIRKK